MSGFGYTYLTEKSKAKELREALRKLENINKWDFIAAEVLNPDADEKELPYLAEEYRLFIDDVERELNDANATRLRGYLDKVNTLIKTAEKGEDPSELEGFIRFNETRHGVVVTALAITFIFGPVIAFTFFNEIGIFSKD